MSVHIKRHNRAVFKLPNSHPAKRFLKAFIECRTNCAGREIDYKDRVAIDQAWTSKLDGRAWMFSGFIYSYICYDIVLDGFLQNAPHLTSSKIAYAQEVPRLRSLMHECADAARQVGNTEILELTDEVLKMFGLWEEYIEFRQRAVAGSSG